MLTYLSTVVLAHADANEMAAPEIVSRLAPEMRRAGDSQSLETVVQQPQNPYPTQGCTTNSDCPNRGNYCFSTSNGPYFRRAEDDTVVQSPINPYPYNPQPTTICGYDPEGWGVGSLCSGQFGDWSDCNEGQNCDTGTCQWNQYSAPEMRRAGDLGPAGGVANPQPQNPYPTQGCTTNSDCPNPGNYCFSNGPYFRRAEGSMLGGGVQSPINPYPYNPQPTTYCGYDSQGWGVGSLCSGQFGDWSDCNKGQNCNSGTCEWNQYQDAASSDSYDSAAYDSAAYDSAAYDSADYGQ